MAATDTDPTDGSDDDLPWAPAMDQGDQDGDVDLSELSNVACPGCGFLPRTFRGAVRHLLAHLVGRHTTGAEQLAALRDEADGSGGEA